MTVHGEIPAQRLTLGGLHRALLPGTTRSAARSVVQFEQRSMLRDTSGGDPRLFAVRRFEAELALRGGAVVAARLETRAAGGSLSRIELRLDGSVAMYSLDGERFGLLKIRPRLFDLHRFERRLDAIPLQDAVVEAVAQSHDERTVIDCDIDPQSFRVLLALFRGDDADDADAASLRSYSVALAAGDDVSLDYWWSLAGDDEHAEDGADFEHNVSCHVVVRVTPLGAPPALPTVTPSPQMPELRHLDDVWALARQG